MTSPPRPSMVARKARRMLHARRSGASLWHHLAHVGVLGWLFVMPVVLGLFLGRLLAARLGTQAPLFGGLFLGLGVGAYVVWRQLRRALDEEEDEQGGAR